MPPKKKSTAGKVVRRKAVKSVGSGGSKNGERSSSKTPPSSVSGGSVKSSQEAPPVKIQKKEDIRLDNFTLYRCLFCPFDTLNKEKWDAHKMCHTPPTGSATDVQSCPFCNFKIKFAGQKDQFLLLKHISGHYKSLQSRSHIFSPIKPERPAAPLIFAAKNNDVLYCEFCDRSFKNMDILKNHKLSHMVYNGNMKLNIKTSNVVSPECSEKGSENQSVEETKTEKVEASGVTTCSSAREGSVLSEASSSVQNCVVRILDDVQEMDETELVVEKGEETNEHEKNPPEDKLSGLKNFMEKYDALIDEYDKRSIDIFMNCKFGPDWRFESDEFLKKIIVQDGDKEWKLLLDFRTGEWGVY